MKLRVAARPSKLSLTQVKIAMEYISKKIGGLTYEIVPTRTRGDTIKDKPLHEIGGKGLFEREVDKLVLEGKADIAVHSLKDLPSTLPNGLGILAVPPRGPVEDILVPAKANPLLPPEKLPPGTLIAAGSPRRKYAILHVNSQVETTWIRGNIDTRLRKLDSGHAQYLITARAGLERLSIDRPYLVLPIQPFTPAPGQGTIAIVGPLETSISRRLGEATHEKTHKETIAERIFLETLAAGCAKPVGGIAFYENGLVQFIAATFSIDGRGEWFNVKGKDPVEVGVRAAEAVKSVPWW
ncbi:MAG: hydroxymethylbilane synthase [Desulfurococcales archaeon]|nr:hydroxymethylbilane synthase [Desulfurococcales archaeon]